MELFEAIRKKKANRDWGGRIVYGNYKYCFQPLKFELADDGRYYYSEPMADEEWKDLEIVARGILADYIKTSDEKQIKQIFEDYYTECLKTYKDNKQRKHDIDIMLKSESEIETLFVETMLEEEAWRIEVSLKKLEKYTTDEERTVLQKVGDGFMAHLQKRLHELRPTPTKSKPRKKVSHDYFKCNQKQEKVCRIFKNLKGQYIDESTAINDWLLACGFQSNDKTPFKPIKWLAQLNELVYLIDMLSPSCRWRWKAAEHCFTIDDNPPDNGAMRTESSAPTITKEKIYKLDKVLEIN